MIYYRIVTSLFDYRFLFAHLREPYDFESAPNNIRIKVGR